MAPPNDEANTLPSNVKEETSPQPEKRRLSGDDEQTSSSKLASSPEHQLTQDVTTSSITLLDPSQEQEESGDFIRHPEFSHQPVKSKGRPEAVWLTLEPEGSWDPSHTLEYTPPHDLVVHFKLSGPWLIRGASVRGKRHRHHGSWREDDLAAGEVDGWRFLIACDGAGSATLSRIGSHIAAQSALESLKSSLAGHPQGPVDPEKPDTLRLVKQALKQAGLHALNQIKSYTESIQVALNTCHTTLTILLAWQDEGVDCFGLLQVGDGAIALLDQRGICKVFGRADYGEHEGETLFLTSLDAAPSVDIELGRRIKFTTLRDHSQGGEPVPLIAAAVMTDGVSDEFFPEEFRLVDLFTSHQLEHLLDEHGMPQAGLFSHRIRSQLLSSSGGTYLSQWLNFEKRQSFDDRSLLLLINEEHATSFTGG